MHFTLQNGTGNKRFKAIFYDNFQKKLRQLNLETNAMIILQYIKTPNEISYIENAIIRTKYVTLILLEHYHTIYSGINLH